MRGDGQRREGGAPWAGDPCPKCGGKIKLDPRSNVSLDMAPPLYAGICSNAKCDWHGLVH